MRMECDTAMEYYLAIDIGASSGRHMIGWLENDTLQLQEVYRFENRMVKRNGHLCWDVQALFSHILAGLKCCKTAGKAPRTMGIDTWAVDYALLDKNGQLLGDVVAYRDSRTNGVPAQVESAFPFSSLYQITGIQKQQFNTLYQLIALQQNNSQLLRQADSLLMIPDYYNCLLTGVKKQEYTNATSTALVNAYSKTWDGSIIERLGLPGHLFGTLSMPGTMVGAFTREIELEVGFSCTVVLPATHDTASAYLAVPALHDRAVFLSSGTWSLLGVEQETPNTGSAAMHANFTNEGGYNGNCRFLKNIMGLWMIQSIRREQERGYSYAELEAMAKAETGFHSMIDVNAEEFLAPKNMTQAVTEACYRSGQPVPQNLGQVLRCVYHSLARCYADAITELREITGKPYDCLHIVGGGSKDGYLNQLTASAAGLPVYAGPAEGTVIGNLAAQMIADGKLRDARHARETIHNSFAIREYIPNADKE